MKKLFIQTILLFAFLPLFSQELPKKEYDKEFEEADIVFNYGEDYDKAAELYEKLYNAYPENANLAAKLGMCYLNIDGRDPDALELLKKAVKNTVEKEADYKEHGTLAPLDSWIYLGHAYQDNNKFELALEAYNSAKKILGTDDEARTEYIDMQIRDCKYAIEMFKRPLTIISQLFVPWLKDYPGACNPVISKNDSVFIFTQKDKIKTKVFCSYKKGNTWKKPVDITKQLGGYDRFYTNSTTEKGDYLVIFMDDGEDGNLYYSVRKDSTWSKIASMGSNINTIYWESHGFITPDGKSLYVASDRKGGLGRSDIWLSQRNADGTWGKPVNCGNVINTSYNETAPYYDPQSKALLFSSNGHRTIGDADVFRTVDKNGIWTEPVGIPYAFNTVRDNSFFIQNNEGPGFITSIYDTKTKVRNIYAVVAEDPAEKLNAAQGTITLSDGGRIDPAKVQITLTEFGRNRRNSNISLFDSSTFKFEVKPGDYRLLVSHSGYKTDTINLNVPLYFQGNFIAVDATLTPEKAAEESLTIRNILFDYDSYTLDAQATESLDLIKTLLDKNPNLKIEVGGYTDAKGSSTYNRMLADKRAQAAIDYLVAKGISPQIFTKKAYGKTDFVVENTNPDGTDNPEGRKYNRRVIFGILDTKTGVTIAQESYVPAHLRSASTTKYSIVLVKSPVKLPDNHFINLQVTEFHFIRTIETESQYQYVLGTFRNRPDAEKYLEYAKKNGFNDAYIINQYDVLKVSGGTGIK